MENQSALLLRNDQKLLIVKVGQPVVVEILQMRMLVELTYKTPLTVLVVEEPIDCEQPSC